MEEVFSIGGALVRTLRQATLTQVRYRPTRLEGWSFPQRWTTRWKEFEAYPK